MISKIAQIEWKFADEPAELTAIDTEQPVLAPSSSTPRGSTTRLVEFTLALVLFFTVGGYMVWQADRSPESASFEATTSTTSNTLDNGADATQKELPFPDLAMMDVEADRQVEDSWLSVTSQADYWGEVRTLTTRYFHFEFQARDASVVEQVAARIDAFYLMLHQQLGVASPPTAHKINIKVEADPNLFHTTIQPTLTQMQLQVASPTLLPIPTDGSEAELLTQQIWRPLIGQLLYQHVASISTPWWHDPATQGLYLWLTRYWLGEPFLSYGEEARLKAWQQWLAQNPPPLLAELTPTRLTKQAGNMQWIETYVIPAHNRQVIAALSIIDYGLTTYGQGYLSQLIDALAHQRSWIEVVPQVFGVSVESFEAGWHEYLTE